MLEATGRRLSEDEEAAFGKTISLAVLQILNDNGLSVALDKISVEVNKAEGLATVTTRLPTATQTNTAVNLVGAVDDKVFWTSLEDKMAGFAIAQVGEVQQTLVSFDPPALPAFAPPAPPVTPELAGVTKSSSDLEGGAIVGIVIGLLAAMALLGAAVYFVRNKRRYNKANQNILKIMRGDEGAITIEPGQSEDLQLQRRQHGCGQLRLPPRAAEQSCSICLGSGSRPGLGSEQRTQRAALHNDALGDGVVGDTGWEAPTLSPEEVAAKAAAKAAAKERYSKAYADPAGKHVATQLPADTGALRPSQAGVEEGTPLRPIERARSHNRATRQRQQQTGVAAAKAETLAAPTLSP